MRGIVARVQLVTGASLASVPAVLVFVAVSMSPNVMYDVLTEEGPVGPWLASSATATLAGVGVIAALRPWLLARRPASADTSIALTALAAAALVKSAVISILASPMSASWLLHVDSAAPVGQRMLTNLAYTMLGVGIACAVVTRGREHRERRRLLVAEQERLVAASSTMAEGLREAEEELRTETHAVLDPALAAVKSALEASPGAPDSDRVLQSMSLAVSEVIRPMSHRYARESPAVSLPSAPSKDDSHEPFALVGAKVDAPMAIRPWLILVISALSFVLIAPLAGAPARAYAVAAVTYVVTSLFLLGIRLAWPRRWRVLNGGAALVWLLAVYLLVFAVTGLAFESSRLVGDWPNFGLMSLGYRTLISMAISMLVLVQQQRRIVDEGIEQVNAALTRQLAVMRREVWSIRRRMSLVLHGSVQSALISAMLLLREDSGPTQVAEVRHRLDQTLSAIDLDAQAATVIEHGLREISTLWSGLAVVELDISPDALVHLGEQPGLSSAVLEIVREAVGNSVRHGHAKAVIVQIEMMDGGLVNVSVRDDGSGLVAGAGQGLGSQMLDEVCIMWERSSGAPGVTLRALLA